MRWFVACLLAAHLFPASVIACSKDAPTARLPGYNDDQMWERAYAMWKDWDTISDYNRAKSLRDEATSIYLAQVKASERNSEKFTTTAVIEPLAPIKGDLPKTPVTLVGYIPDSCGGANGDGDGAYSKAGEWIVVYTGVAKRPDRPNGIDSLVYADLRDIDILDAVDAWLSTKPDYKPF